MDPLALFGPATRSWFEASFPAPTPAQAEGWPAIADGAHTLIHAPTGSGKTLAAFLWGIDRLLAENAVADPDPGARCRLLYVSPLKALAHDIDRNLRAPLQGIRHAAERHALPPGRTLDVALRTGDTSREKRRRMARHPPDVLITTPESLYLLLTSRSRELLRSVRCVIVDEIHAVAGTKRGAHLAVSLERLAEVAAEPVQRIGLSATQRPLETTARFLGGNGRPVTIVDAAAERELDVEVVVPADDMSAPVWPEIYPDILDVVAAHRSTIVFANSRRQAERICSEVNALAGRELLRAHHGSVSREQRLEIEEGLKAGSLAGVVATSTLELGIDMGAVDIVVHVESPPSVAAGLQRVGRAGHHAGGVARARVYPKYRGDLLQAAVVTRLMAARTVEEIRLPENPLDVLAQHLVAAVAVEDRTATGLYDLVRRSASFAALPRSLFDATLDMLAGRYPSDLFAELRPRVTWDRVTDVVSARPGARHLAVVNGGTIPDRGLYRVTLPDGARVGELDEEMVYESRPGDVFVLGATSWRIVEVTADRVVVEPAPGEVAAKTPFWHGDGPGRPVEVGRAVGELVRRLAGLPGEEARALLGAEYRLDERAADNLVRYVAGEREATGVVPTDGTLVVERFRDEIGDWRLVLLSPFGARVHAPWATALEQRAGHPLDAVWSDDGIVLRFPDTDEPPDPGIFALDPDEVDELLVAGLGGSALFAARFREAAARSLLLPRRRPNERTPLWLQRRKAADLLSVARGFPSFPIVLETYREILSDDFDVPALRSILAGVASRRIRLVPVDVPLPSPFASSLLFSFVAAFLYEGDAPLAERRAAALTLDRALLAELLGEGDLADLLSPDAVAAVAEDLQRLTPGRAARGADDVHDLLRDLGPLDTAAVAARAPGLDADAVLSDLAASRRIIPVRIAGTPRWAAVEDAARLRDALGVQPPPGVPLAHLEPVPDPLGDVVGRYARTHPPFTVGEAVADLGLPPAVVGETLSRLAAAGRVVSGSHGWSHPDVLRRIKRRTLASLRSEIEAVDPASLGRFLPAWHGIGGRRPTGPGALLEAVERLEGAEIPASLLDDILAARVDTGPDVLDRLLLGGEVVWAGRGALGPRDGRIALYTRARLPLLWHPPRGGTDGAPVHDALLGHLAAAGASFFPDLYAAAGGGDPGDVVDALWDLVWAGRVTNDSLLPLRGLLAGGRRRPARALPSRVPPAAAGRWSLLAVPAASPEERRIAWTETLLRRHGVVARATVAAEGVPGGFAGLYPVLSRMEETGRARRGYFVEGLGGAQLAEPGAVELLRSPRGPAVVTLAAADPANPYGAVLPWPPGPRLSRAAGTFVVLVDGSLAAHTDGRRLVVAPGVPAEPVATALAELGTRRRLRVDALSSFSGESDPAWTGALLAAGFVPSPRGLLHPGPHARRALTGS